MAATPSTVELVTDVARTLYAQGIPINQETEDSQYALFFEKHLANLFHNSSADFVIYDRTILDSISYAQANGNLAASWLQFAKTVAKNTIGRIDMYFFIPIEFPLHKDGVRPPDVRYQAQVNQAILEVLDECGPKYTTIVGGRENRVQQAVLRLSLAEESS